MNEKTIITQFINNMVEILNYLFNYDYKNFNLKNYLSFFESDKLFSLGVFFLIIGFFLED